ncbi:hypothetical protein IWQ57_000403 [Coemansia nantahalensis]|uniref:Uncharacterized protein n=1 Tax=Coemansia nantahalensis TaxID=2789366 RepID=A0ACC1K8E8_9FUNG|nr:hypothetical protein IWQ57_000403 [Coemansia nantahalensis]
MLPQDKGKSPDNKRSRNSGNASEGEADKRMRPDVAQGGTSGQAGTPDLPSWMETQGPPPAIKVSDLQRSRVHGRIPTTSTCDWKSFANSNYILVDKSVAIMDIMCEKCPTAVAGLFPRRMGKTAFLELLQHFLAVTTTVSYEKRRNEFQKYTIYLEHREFFDEHFAKYPVIRMDLKNHIDFLEVLTGDSGIDSDGDSDIDSDIGGAGLDVGAHNLAKIEKKARSLGEEIGDVIRSYRTLKSLGSADVSNMPEIKVLLPDLMKLLYRLFQRKAVVIVDEYDAPFARALVVPNVGAAMHNEIHCMYADFLGDMLKNNEYLHRGVLVGVFDPTHVGAGSGLNNIVKFMAHSGIGAVGFVTHPFQRAFGFTCQDVWGLINHYIDNIWRGYRSCDPSKREAFKKQLLRGCIRHFGGYRIGSAAHVCSPYAVMRFIEDLKLVSVPDAGGLFEEARYWADTGRLSIIRSITVDSIHHLQRYFGYLSVAFLQQRAAMRYDDAVQTQEQGQTDDLDDLVVGQINSQPQTQSPAEYDEATGKEIADICMYRPSVMVDDLDAGRGLQAATVMQTMYQAGCLVPVSNGRVAIPNTEAYDNLARLYQRIATQHSMGMRMDKHIETMGICNENVPKFANFLCQMLDSYDGPVTAKNDVRMGNSNRQQVAAYAWGRSLGAQTQVYQRYFRGIAAKIEHCKIVYDIGLTFWMNRFCMVVTKRVRSSDSEGADVWQACRFADDVTDPDIDLSHADLSAVTYDSLGDCLGSPSKAQVRIIYRCGRLIAISI